jgi:hypothetical protein
VFRFEGAVWDGLSAQWAREGTTEVAAWAPLSRYRGARIT